jgi:hypothetical protein
VQRLFPLELKEKPVIVKMQHASTPTNIRLQPKLTLTRKKSKRKSEDQQSIPYYLKPRSEQSNEEIQRDIERLKNMKILPPPEELVYYSSDLEVIQKVQERRKIQSEIRKLEVTKSKIPEEPTSVKQWKMDNNGNIIGFSVTDARIDILYRLNQNILYTFAECEIIIKEVVRVQQREASMDLKNLMFLSSFRTEMCFPKPALTNYLGDIGIEGFSDNAQVRRLLYEDIPDQDNETLQSPYQKANADHLQSIPILKPKEQLYKLLRKVNRGIVTLIDNGLRQRKERLLLCATILEELERNKDLEQKRVDLLIQKTQQKIAKKKRAHSILSNASSDIDLTLPHQEDKNV